MPVTQNRHVAVILCIVMLVVPASGLVLAAAPPQGLIPYEEIGPRLAEIEASSDRVEVEVIGQSAGGRDLYLVTVADPDIMGRLDHYKALRNLMLTNPEQAQAMVDRFDDFRVPVFINASIHGDEYEGVDAAIRLIETLAFEESEEARAILDNMILLINVVANPDGRVLHQRQNANNFDLNRDYITQSQPETQAAVPLIAGWNPMVLLDLHGYYNPMLIEPCTPPHNPNYEYDIFIKWALDQAEAMESELLAQTGFEAQIPYRDWEQGWDDWAPIFAPMYAMYHGAYGYTLETPFVGERGVAAHYAAVWGALKFVTEHRKEMIWDQIEIFRRGFLDLPQMLISDELLNETPYDQYPELTTIEFPAAYVIPAAAPLQSNPQQAARLVNFLRFNDVQVSAAGRAFDLDGVSYPAGTYIVWMDQPKRGLANTILWDGWDISQDPGLNMYDISSWSHPHLWGATRAIMQEDLVVPSTLLRRDVTVAGSVEAEAAPAAYAFRPDSNQVILAVNELLERGVDVYRLLAAYQDGDHMLGAGTLIVPPDAALADELARVYHLQVAALASWPASAEPLSMPRLAVAGDEGTTWFLDTYGFAYRAISTSDLAQDDLSDVDVLICQTSLLGSLNQTGAAELGAFFERGGDLIGIGAPGAELSRQFGLAPNLSYSSQSGNGIVAVTYDPADLVSAQYPADGYAFVYRPTWFTSVPEGWQVSAALDPDAFFVSGYWAGWAESGAAGQPIVIHGQAGASEVTLIGFAPTFRAHPEHTFRILANAIYGWEQ